MPTYMNNIQVLPAAIDAPWERMSELFQTVGWGRRSPDEIEHAFRCSSFARFAYCDGDLIGFGRTVDDGKYYALIVDLVIDPGFQGRGIGKRILAELRDSLDGFLFTTLTAAPGKDQFYLGHGWKRQTTAFIWPRSETQLQQHALAEGEQGDPADGLTAATDL